MRTWLAIMTVTLLVGCNAQEARKAEDEAATELKKAREAVVAEVKDDLKATEKSMDELRANIKDLEHEAAGVYRAAIDEADDAFDVANSEWEKVADGTNEAFKELGAEAREANAAVERQLRRLAALTGDVKDDFIREADAVLGEIRDDVGVLETKMADLGDEARKEYDSLATQFKKDYQAAENGVQKAKNAADDSWKDVRHDVNHDLLKLKSEVRKAHDKLVLG